MQAKGRKDLEQGDAAEEGQSKPFGKTVARQIKATRIRWHKPLREELLVPAALGLGNGVRVGKKMINVLGPVADTELLPGEMVAVRTKRVLSRKGHSVVRVRLFGEASLGWLDISMLWGACVELFVCQGGNAKHLTERLYPDVHIASLAEALTVPPYRSWDGVLISTIRNELEAQELHSLAGKWGPLVIIIATHTGSISRPSFDKWTDYADLGYAHRHMLRCHHKIRISVVLPIQDGDCVY
eukprot:scaffold40171_cov59-Cyclotella_meneghiniana.AAC.2